MSEVVFQPLFRIRVAKFTRLGPQLQTWVEIASEIEGTYVLEPLTKFRSSIGLVIVCGIILLKPTKKEKVLMTDFRQTPTDLTK